MPKRNPGVHQNQRFLSWLHHRSILLGMSVIGGPVLCALAQTSELKIDFRQELVQRRHTIGAACGATYTASCSNIPDPSAEFSCVPPNLIESAPYEQVTV